MDDDEYMATERNYQPKKRSSNRKEKQTLRLLCNPKLTNFGNKSSNKII